MSNRWPTRPCLWPGGYYENVIYLTKMNISLPQDIKTFSHFYACLKKLVATQFLHIVVPYETTKLDTSALEGDIVSFMPD